MQARDLIRSQYPARLAKIARSLDDLSLSRELDGPHDAVVVAIVGAREATEEALTFAHDLARACVRAGGIVASGGALGIDSAAHRGALEAGGETWAVLGTGREHTFPVENAGLFEEIAHSPRGCLFWPFAPSTEARPQNFPKRNGVLVALADVVVVVQAALESGSLNTAAKARKMEKPLWVVTPAPWLDQKKYQGNRIEIRKGCRMLDSKVDFLAEVFPGASFGASAPTRHHEHRSDEEKALLAAATNRPKHLDDLCESSGLSPALAATALLTLALEHVLVEGPPGYYRRGPSG